MIDYSHALRCYISFRAQTGLLIRSGSEGEFTDSTIECDPNGRMHINGYVWAGLMRRAVERLEGGAAIARSWGKMSEDELRVSPLWTEATFLRKEDFDVVVNPGIRIDREWGVTEDGALYEDELAIPLADIPCRFTIFCSSEEEAGQMKERVADLLWVIGEGIETVGGGWAYGFGRLQPAAVHFAVLDLRTPNGRDALWKTDFKGWQEKVDGDALAVRRPAIAAGKGWRTLLVEAGVADGQLLAIHTKTPPLTEELPIDMPDAFVLHRPRINTGGMETVPVITGKAFRQTVLSREIERRLRSTGEKACLNSSDEKRQAVIPAEEESNRCCNCKRCLWFGDTRQSGILSVGDAEVVAYKAETLHRIALCEHSLQNINLFSGEYLTRGRFTMKIIIDAARGKDPHLLKADECADAVYSVLAGMQPGKSPPGWVRIGATTGCTGQLTIHAIQSATTGGI